MNKLFGHLRTVLKHKRYVRRACFKMGIYRQGIFHDMSKFTPSEFIPSVKYYAGVYSPTIEERNARGASYCWMHHKGRNKHHYEYWTDYPLLENGALTPVRMPLRYLAEMIADRYAACVAYNGRNYNQRAAWEYFDKGKNKHLMHRDTKAVLEKVLIVMRDEGEERAFAYMRSLLAKTKDADYTAEGFGIETDD